MMELKRCIAILVIPVLILTMVIGCSEDKGADSPSDKEAQVAPAADQPREENEPATSQPEPADQPKEMPPDAKKIVDSISKITSYAFSNDNGIVYLKGSDAKLDLYNHWGKKGEGMYDAVYLDLSAKKAYAVCEEVDLCPYERRKQYWVVDYAEFDLGKLPIDYVKEITYAEIDYSKTRTIKRHAAQAEATLFKYRIGGTQYEAWLDNFYGFPYEITMKDVSSGSSTMVEFKDVQINFMDADGIVKVPSSFKLVG